MENAAFLNGIIERYDFEIPFPTEEFDGWVDSLDNYRSIEEYDILVEGHPNRLIYQTINEYIDFYAVDTPHHLQTAWARETTKYFQCAYNLAHLLSKDEDPFMRCHEYVSTASDDPYGWYDYPHFRDITLGIALFLLGIDTAIEHTDVLDKFITKAEERYSQPLANGKDSYYTRLSKAYSAKKSAATTDADALETAEDNAELLFDDIETELKWARWVKEFLKREKINTPLDGSMRNATLASMYYFREVWVEKKILHSSNATRDALLLSFFVNRCGVSIKNKNGKFIADKTINNKLAGLRNDEACFKKTSQIDGLEEIIEDFVAEKL